jgi:hypothetical protein
MIGYCPNFVAGGSFFFVTERRPRLLTGYGRSMLRVDGEQT